MTGDAQGALRTTIRPNLIVLVVWELSCAGWVIVSMRDSLRDLVSSDGIAALLMVAVGCLGVVYGLRQRVEIDGPVARIVHLASVDELHRSDILAVVLAGGHGKPSHLQLDTNRETSGRYLDATRWPPRLKRQHGNVSRPFLIGANRLGRGLGVPVIPWGGLYPSQGAS